jgi:hypothetical protein
MRPHARPSAGRAVCALCLIAALAALAPAAALADDLGTGSGTGAQGTLGQLGQLAQTVQQLSQTVQQMTQAIGGIYQVVSSGILGGLGGIGNILGGLGSGGIGNILGGLGGGGIGNILGGLGGIFGIGGLGGGGTPPLLGGGVQLHLPSFSPTSWLSAIQQILAAITGQNDTYVADEWGAEWGMAPDYSYSSGVVASELRTLAGQLKGSGAQFLTAIANALGSAPAPQPGTPQWSSSNLASASPDFAAQAHAVGQSQAGALGAQGISQSAADKANEIAQSASSDTTPQDAATASQAVANVTQEALAAAPSTRAAVVVMGTALAEQQAEQAAQNAALAARLDALLAQQAQLALQLSQVSAGLSAVAGLEAQQVEKQLEAEAAGADLTTLGSTGALQGVLGAFNTMVQAPQTGNLDTFLQSVRSAVER